MGEYKVNIRDAAGVVAIDGLQLIVRPKIPTDHLFFMLAETDSMPRTRLVSAHLSRGESVRKILARWSLQALEDVLRCDLIRDGVPRADELQLVRGRVSALPTVRNYYRERVGIV